MQFNLRHKYVISNNLIVRYIIVNHAQRGHLSKEAEKKFLSEVYFRGLFKRNLNKLLTRLRRKRLYCKISPRLIAQPSDIKKLTRISAKIFIADYLYINSMGYTLVFPDSTGRNVQMTFSEVKTASRMVVALLSWRANVLILHLFLDLRHRGSHFSNE
eukprot:snap_masked-scaffold_61-processed-gene-0.55-mRNA-1 protein AED:1.00 eAED:1.00 QI:0/0/0/0/1/1/2/0/157